MESDTIPLVSRLDKQNGGRIKGHSNGKNSHPGSNGTNGTNGTHYGAANGKGDGKYYEFPPVLLSWEDVVVKGAAKTEKKSWLGKRKTKGDPELGKRVMMETKEILRNVTGIAEPGTLTAIMGASGAGKTTLLNTLNLRSREGLEVSGSILVNGRPIGHQMARLSAYVQQDDLFLSNLTVKEHLTFQAWVRMDREIPMKSRLHRVDEVIRALGLSKCSDTVIGNPDRGIKGTSGGERKRLSFASEVLTNPSLMFCDEPTSGLDSYMAQNVVETLRGLASEGRTILSTIHQPSSEVFAMFDRILLIAEGRTAFIGTTKEAIDFFSNLGYVCPKNYNPADFFIQTLAIVPGEEDHCKEKVEAITEAYDVSENSKKIRVKIPPTMSHALQALDDEGENSPYKASWWQQFRACSWRAFQNNRREPLMTTVRFTQTVVIALILGLVFLRQHIDQAGIQNINGCLFIIITNSAFSNTFAAVQIFPLEMALIKREHFNGMYRVDAVFISKVLVELPFQYIFLPIIFMTLPYWMVGMYPYLSNYVVACCISILVTNSAVSFGYLLSSLSGTVSIALAITPPLLLPFMLFGGLFINLADIPVYIRWVSRLSWFSYSYEAFLINQWGDIDHIACPVNSTIPCISNGNQVLESSSFSKNDFAIDFIGLFALIIGYRLVAYIVLLIRCRRKK
ncbi:protein white-like [Strongylocentrotus purpuratus]|uniref:ABC transporter domain-containing protein n=1 Tax=Strongylocentrotus purpuratus TaxID=7668 RepID=A0A7M7T2N3_STRPU|nr:protein white-like [Strongylocentrotus purpuratus]